MVDYLRRRFQDSPFSTLWRVLDSETILLVKWIFYVIIVWLGFYNLFLVDDEPVELLAKGLPSPWMYETFFWFCIGGPIASLAGRYCKGQWAYTGMLGQLTGDFAVFGVCLTYVAATFYSDIVGKGNVGGYFVMAFGIVSFFFVIRDIRRISQRDRWVSVKK